MTRLELLALYDAPLPELAARADRARREAGVNGLALCSIINARSGLCGEDCKFCAQSARHATGVPEYPLKDTGEIVAAAERAKASGAGHFGIVTSGRGLSDGEVEAVVRAVAAIRREVGITPCASLGCLEPRQFAMLKAAGLVRYHHNIETSERFFPSIVTTHTFADRLRTIRSAAEAGLSVCSGGIIGMGETREDRVDMALALRDLPVESVPINVLMPIAGTPLAGAAPLGAAEVLKTVAIFRILMPGRAIKLAAGRDTVLADFQGMAFMGGANGMIIGDYLTQPGRAQDADRRLVEEIRQAWSG